MKNEKSGLVRVGCQCGGDSYVAYKDVETGEEVASFWDREEEHIKHFERSHRILTKAEISEIADAKSNKEEFRKKCVDRNVIFKYYFQHISNASELSKVAVFNSEIGNEANNIVFLNTFNIVKFFEDNYDSIYKKSSSFYDPDREYGYMHFPSKFESYLKLINRLDFLKTGVLMLNASDLKNQLFIPSYEIQDTKHLAQCATCMSSDLIEQMSFLTTTLSILQKLNYFKDDERESVQYFSRIHSQLTDAMKNFANDDELNLSAPLNLPETIIKRSPIQFEVPNNEEVDKISEQNRIHMEELLGRNLQNYGVKDNNAPSITEQ